MATALHAATRTLVPPIPAPALQDLSNFPALRISAAPIAPTGDALHGSRNPELDLVIIWGPGQDELHFPSQLDPHTPAQGDRDLDAIRQHYQKLGLRVEMMETDGMSQDEMERIKCEWYMSGKLGPRTQVLISAHGGASGPDGKHHLELSTKGKPRETGAFLSWLRTPPSGLPPGPQDPGWHGIAHLHSCAGGLLAAELQTNPTEWNRGNLIAHAARKQIAMPTLRSLAFHLCDAISEGRNRPDPLQPIAMAAHAMRVAGETMYCAGADFDAPLKIGAPRNDEQACMATVIASLESGRHGEARISGSEKDRAALLAAMRSQCIAPDEETCDEEKLSNMILTRMARARLHELETLQQDHPEAHELAMRKFGHKTASASAVAWRRWHVEFMREARNGRATPERLRAYLKHTQRYDQIAPEWPARIAPVLRENLALLLVALSWDEGNPIHGLRGALSREFAEHPENVAKFLAATQGKPDQQALLNRFFENTAFLREACEGRGTPESLRRYLEQTALRDRGDVEWFGRITSVLCKSFELMLTVCAWQWKLMRMNGAPRQKPHQLLDALAHEFAAHPQDIARLLDQAQGNEDHHVYLRAFFETFATGRLTLLQRMDDGSFQRHAESAYRTSLEEASDGEKLVASYIEQRAPELVAQWYRSSQYRFCDEWLRPGEYERLLAAPRELKRKLMRAEVESLSSLRELLQLSNPDTADSTAHMDAVAHKRSRTHSGRGESLLELRPELRTDAGRQQVHPAAIDPILAQSACANDIDLHGYVRL